MTKREELQVIDTAILALGEQSYLGPWLKNLRPLLESTIMADLEPTFSAAQVAREVSEHQQKMAAIREELTAAVAIREASRSKASEVAARMRNLRNTLRSIDRDLTLGIEDAARLFTAAAE